MKDIDTEPPKPGFVGFWDPYGPIREKIDQARKKFKEFKDYPCSLVIHLTHGFALIDDPKVIFGAMHGDPGFEFLVDKEKGRLVPDSQREVFTKDGRMTQPHWKDPQNDDDQRHPRLTRDSDRRKALRAHVPGQLR